MMHVTATPQTKSSTPTDTAVTTVLVADSLAAFGLDALRNAGCQVRVQADLTADTLPDAVRAYDPERDHRAVDKSARQCLFGCNSAEFGHSRGRWH